eukprot:Rhum_TRINITY_DN9558_c0_g3::Rhum_TRINITY_DN9558_c0_g3_i1::g.33988::m.33988
MLSKVFCAALFAGSVSAAQHSRREWCASPPLPNPHAGPSLSDAKSGLQFRGSFRDLSLFIHSEAAAAPELDGEPCADFDRHRAGNDGLWVLEFDYEKDMKASRAEAERKGLRVYLTRNNTYVAGGGDSLPEKLGVDTCGADLHQRVISVAPAPVRPQAPLTGEARARRTRASKTVNAGVQEAVETVKKAELEKFLETLAGFNSRNSYTGSNLDEATQLIADNYAGLGMTVTRKSFRDDMSALVVAEVKGHGKDKKVVVIGAHADSRSTDSKSPTQRAPGADDNGTGTTALWAVANALSKTKLKFYHDLRLVSFTGEEQGLLGSRALAKEYAEAGVEVQAMINGDMLGYREPGEPITLAFVDRNADPEITSVARDIVKTYLPNLRQGSTTACCSDQQSFYEQGYPALGLFEHPGTAVEYPQYHKSNDLPEFVDFDQLEQEAKAFVALAFALSEPLEN